MSSKNKKGAEKQAAMLAALERNIPESARLPVPLTPSPQKEVLISDSEEDYKFSREKLKNLITKAEQSLDRLITVADEAEHPRAFEVLAGMLTATSEMTDKLMELQRKRKELIVGKKPDDAPPAGSPTNVAVFIGTTADLQKQLTGMGGSTTEATVVETAPPALLEENEKPQ